MVRRTSATVGDLEDFISNKAREYCGADPTRLPPCVGVPFRDWEAQFFMRGLELGLFAVNDGLLYYQRLGRHLGRNARNVTSFFFPHQPRKCREVVTQFAALTELIDAYGWPVENVVAEPPARGRANKYAFDGLVFDRGRPSLPHEAPLRPVVHIAVEAKINSNDVEKLIRTIDKCVHLGLHERHDHPSGEQSDHSKFLGIIEWKPTYFLAVTPKERKIFLVSWDNEARFSLAEVNDIPRWSPC
jgi:hypothetical protein